MYIIRLMEVFQSLFLNESKEIINQNALGCVLLANGNFGFLLRLAFLRVNLSAYEKGQLKYKKYVYQLDSPDSGHRERITSIFQAKDGTVWLGSNGNGFYKVIRKKEMIINFKLIRRMMVW